MATYKSQDTDLLAPADAVFSRLDNLEGLGEMIKNVPEEQIPADQRQMLEQVKVTSDTISFPGGLWESLLSGKWSRWLRR